MRPSQRLRRLITSERGEGETHFFMIVVLAAVLFSSLIWLLDYVKDVKYERYHRTQQTAEDDKPAPFNPAGQSYTVVY